MKNIIITSTHPRHKYYAGLLYESTHIDCIIWEDKPITSTKLNITEQSKYKKYLNFKFNCQEIKIDKGEINSDHMYNIIKNIKPDIIFVFGSSLLKPEIFNLPNYGCINIHTSLVQYFRGVDSSFWAIHDEKPQAIGSTLHFINKTIDAGDIIDQRTAKISIEDNLNDLFLKSCDCGFEMLLDNLEDILSKKVSVRKLSNWGKLYTTKDMNEEAKRITKKKLRKVLENYIND